MSRKGHSKEPEFRRVKTNTREEESFRSGKFTKGSWFKNKRVQKNIFVLFSLFGRYLKS